MINKIDKNSIRVGRHNRLRNKISGTAERPRFSVYRSDKHIYVQIIDDVARCTLAAASTVEKEIISAIEGKTKTEAAKIVGEFAAKRALEKGITEVVVGDVKGESDLDKAKFLPHCWNHTDEFSINNKTE